MKKIHFHSGGVTKMDKHKQVFGKGFTIDELLSHHKQGGSQ